MNIAKRDLKKYIEENKVLIECIKKDKIKHPEQTFHYDARMNILIGRNEGYRHILTSK